MKQGWEIKKLGEVATYVNGYAFKPEHWGETGVPIIRIQNLNNLNADFNYCESDIPQKFVIEDGDILISWSASLGVYEWNRGKAYLNQHIFKVVFDKINISKYFLKYAVSAKLNEMLKDAHGATMKHIVKSDFDNTTIPYPPLPEQEKIVAELDCLSGIIEKKKQQLKELDALAESIFYTMFEKECNNWDKWKLIDIYKFIDYRGKTPNKITDGIPLITAKNIRKGYIDYTVREYISEEEFSKRQSRGIAKKGDLLFTTEAPMGNVAIADLDIFSTGQRLISFQKKQSFEVENIYVMYCLLSESFQLELNNQATGATVKGIKGSKLEQMLISLPPLPLQQEFASKIEAIEKQKELIKESIKEVEELFNSRMNYYFG